MSQDVFNQFIANPSNDILKGSVPGIPGQAEGATGLAAFVYPDQGEVFYRGMAAPFIVNSLLINFAGDPSELKKYLAQNGITGNIKNSALFYTAPSIPMTIWVKTDQGNFFITVDEVIPDLNGPGIESNSWNADKYSYTYTFYKQSAYFAKFK